MCPFVAVRISEAMKAEIETIVAETGLWKTQSDFIKEALDEFIQKNWSGERYVKSKNRN